VLQRSIPNTQDSLPHTAVKKRREVSENTSLGLSLPEHYNYERANTDCILHAHSEHHHDHVRANHNDEPLPRYNHDQDSMDIKPRLGDKVQK
jgi:hypothetical protein